MLVPLLLYLRMLESPRYAFRVPALANVAVRAFVRIHVTRLLVLILSTV
jgi:hypothetical protein